MKKLLLMISAMLFLFLGCASETQTDETESIEETTEVVLVDDDVIKASFLKIFEEPSIDDASYLQLLVENKSDEPITVCLVDAYVNDISTVIGSGVPMNIEPGKKSQNPFIVFNHTKDEIENIEFKVHVFDDDMSTIEETETIKVVNE